MEKNENIVTNAHKSGHEKRNVPTLRFKKHTADWVKTDLSNYLYVSTARNKNGSYTKEDVLSVSGELGIVNQIALLGRSYAGESVLPYHIVEVGDIVYTKSPLALYPYGIIKTNRHKDGIVSTLYAVYKTINEESHTYITNEVINNGSIKNTASAILDFVKMVNPIQYSFLEKTYESEKD